jgi:hypothetical protein
MKGGYKCLIIQPISPKMVGKNIIEQILNVLLKHKPIRNALF